MIVAKFQVSTRWSGRKRTIQVVVHSTAKELREEGDKYNHSIGSKEEVGGEAVGLSQGSYKEKYVDGVWIKLPDAGVIRFVAGRTTTGIIAHESTHMACSIYDNDWFEEHGNPFDNMENQEILAYLVGDIASRIVSKLYEYNVIKQE